MSRPPAVRALHASSATGPVVVFLHGMEDTWRTWCPLVDRLDSGWRFYVLDPPWRAGAGYRWRRRSTPGRWLATTLRTLPAPVDVLVGHSLGANAVLESLARSRVLAPAGALLLAPFYCPPELDITWRVFERAQRDFEQIIREALECRLGPRLATLEPSLVDSMVAKMVERIGPVGFTTIFDQFVASADLTFGPARVPTLVVAGDRDPALDAHRAAALRSRLPWASVVMEPGFDHFCQVRQVDAVARHLTGFVEQTCAARAANQGGCA